MNRRDFIKSAISLIGLAIPIEFGAELVITSVSFSDDYIKSRMRLGNYFYDESGQGWINVSLVTSDIWEHVRLKDSDGREWRTSDEGQTWHSGLMSFSLGDL